MNDGVSHALTAGVTVGSGMKNTDTGLHISVAGTSTHVI